MPKTLIPQIKIGIIFSTCAINSGDDVKREANVAGIRQITIQQIIVVLVTIARHP